MSALGISKFSQLFNGTNFIFFLVVQSLQMGKSYNNLQTLYQDVLGNVSPEIFFCIPEGFRKMATRQKPLGKCSRDNPGEVPFLQKPPVTK